MERRHIWPGNRHRPSRLMGYLSQLWSSFYFPRKLTRLQTPHLRAQRSGGGGGGNAGGGSAAQFGTCVRGGRILRGREGDEPKGGDSGEKAHDDIEIFLS